MGFMKWLKKDDTTRRESAPPRSHQNFDPNKTRDESYLEKMAKFNEYRKNQRVSLGANDMSNNTSMSFYQNTNDVLNQTSASVSPARLQQSKNQRARSTSNRVPRSDDDLLLDSNDRKSCNATQFHFTASVDSEVDFNRAPRHSMPASSSSYKHKTRKTKQSFNSNVIHEEEVKEFEGTHCVGSLNGDNQSGCRSPPVKFYKQNSNPYPVNPAPMEDVKPRQLVFTSDEKKPHAACPEKPKRLLLNSNQSRKVLAEAHFNGAYTNFEIHSPYYDESSDDIGNYPPNRPVAADNGSNDDDTSQSTRYQIVVNKHGDEVEYALPCTEQLELNRLRKNAEYLTSDDLLIADEEFQQDPNECERLIDRNFELDSDASHQGECYEMRKPRVMVTDLDKSTDSGNTLEDLNLSKKSGYSIEERILDTAGKQKSPNRDYESVKTMQCANIVYLLNEFRPKKGTLQTTFQSPLDFDCGTFRKTEVCIRKYADTGNGANEIVTFIAENAIVRDLEMLRKIRHRYVINLMDIAFEPLNRMVLIMEPAKHTLNHYLHGMDQQIDRMEAISIIQQISSATLYLHACRFCHSNISSHSILITELPMQVKLSSFELAVQFPSDIQNEVELKNKQNFKRNSMHRNAKQQSKLDSTAVEELTQKYKVLSKTKDYKAITKSVSMPFICELNARYLPYCVEYRQQFSVANYQAPELLTRVDNFVFPTNQSDVYALTLLLWELLNDCVPFVIHDEGDLEELFATDNARLPIIDKIRCNKFQTILISGLEREPENRMSLDDFIDHLKIIASEILIENKQINIIEESLNESKRVIDEMLKNNGYDLPKNNSKRIFDSAIYEKSADDFVGNATPKKCNNKMRSVSISPKISPAVAEKNLSPLNNVTNTTLYRSILDFNKLLSPRRAANANIYERSSTLKKRKKLAPTNQSKKNVKELFNGSGENDDILKRSCIDIDESPKLNENIISERLVDDSSECINSATIQQLELINEEKKHQGTHDKNDEDPEIKQDECELKPMVMEKNKDNLHESNVATTLAADSSDYKANNSSYQFFIDDYELPQQIIARNNKIRRCTWLSSDQVNMTSNSTQYDPPTVTACQNKERISVLNESGESNKKLNVSIKIVHKQLSPVGSPKHDSTPSNNSTSSTETEENFSIQSRIKFFRSLENQPFRRHAANSNRSDASRRSEISFNEARKEAARAQRNTLPVAAAPNGKRQLIQEIKDITAEISKCLSKTRPYVIARPPKLPANTDQFNGLIKGPSTIGELNNSVAMKIIEVTNDNNNFLRDKKDSTATGEVEKRNSVKEAVQRFETSLTKEKNEKNENSSFTKIENKLRNEKINNIEPKLCPLKDKDTVDNAADDDMAEKVEDVLRIVGPTEMENEAGAHLALPATSTVAPQATAAANLHQTQTMIKRTYYAESVVSGTNVEIPELKTLLDSPSARTTTYETTKSSSTTKLTTRVTLNMRRRRSSDAGLFTYQLGGEGNKTNNSPRMIDVRHSICGSPLIDQSDIAKNSDTVGTTSGRRLEEILGGDRNQFENVTQIVSGEQQYKRSSSWMLSDDQMQSTICLGNLTNGVFTNKQIQSIEDLYIDDDFAGVNLAANMKLMANSTDSLDDINFDLISTRIYEQTSESTKLSANYQPELKAIENCENREDANAEPLR